jgi:hypothetical protein
MLTVMDLLRDRRGSRWFTSLEYRIAEFGYRPEIYVDFKFQGIAVVHGMGYKKLWASVEGVGFFKEVPAEAEVARQVREDVEEGAKQ